MKTLKEPDKIVTLSLGTQTYEPNIKYVDNPYIIREGKALFNTLTDEAVLLEDNDSETELVRRWMLIPETTDVRTLMYLIRQKRIAGRNGPGSNLKSFYTIFTTTACNAKCEYCFEKDSKILTMSEEVAEKVADYIIESQLKGKKPIRLKWFGGEPLCNKNVINIISKKLIDNDVNFTAQITSNGDLFDTCTDKELTDIWRLTSVQLTVDDIGSKYDSIKVLPTGAYERLKKTIERFSKLKIRVHLRIHFNPEIGFKVCKNIIEEFKNYPNILMYTRLIFHNESKEYYDELLKVEAEIESTGKNSYSFPNYSTPNHCMADSLRMVTITPEGYLVPCEHYTYGEHVYGSVFTKRKNQEILDKWALREKYTKDECKSCPLYPSCRKLVMCPAEGKCSDGYQYYQIETIKRALRKKVEEINGRNSNTDN